MASDRSVRFLHALGGASTSRVLNLVQIAKANRDNPDHAARPLFLAPIVNASFILKHRMRGDETYLFTSARSVATKLIVPFDVKDLRAGGRSVFIDQRGFTESLRSVGHYSAEALERDLKVMKLLGAVPSLDPFLLREHLRNNEIDVASCYFALSSGDQERMHDFVSWELSRLIRLAAGSASDSSTSRMVSAMLSSRVDEKLEPLRVTLGLTGEDFREGVFSWRGFLYYKWSMTSFWPDVMGVLRQIRDIQPHGAVDNEQRIYLAAAKRSIIEMVRDHSNQVNKVLAIYDESFADLVAYQAPRTFRDFLLSAPYMFLELGEKMGAISHIASFWRYRFPPGAPAQIDAEELSAIFQDFTSGFADQSNEAPSSIKKPVVLQAR